MITASALPRVTVCPASEALPHVDRDTAAAAAGTARHDERDALVVAGDAESLPAEVVALFPSHAIVESEVALAYDYAADDGRRLGHVDGRRYEVGPTEIPGRADLLVTTPTSVLVVDWKGWAEADPWEQLTLYAAAEARRLGLDEATLAVRYETGRLEIRQLDALDMAAFRSRLLGTVERVAAAKAAAEPTVRASRHCRYCPARLACPTMTAAIRHVEGNPSRGPVTGEEMTRLYQLTKRVEAWLGEAKAAIHGYTEDYAIDLGDGRLYAKRATKGRESLDGDKTYEVVKRLHGQAIADAAVERTATKKRLTEALGLVAAKGKVKATVDAALEEIRAADGVAVGEPGSKREEVAALPTTTEHHPAITGSEAA